MRETTPRELVHPDWNNPTFSVDIRRFTGRMKFWSGEIKLNGELYEEGGFVTGVTRNHVEKRARKFVAKERQRIQAQRQFSTNVEVIEL